MGSVKDLKIIKNPTFETPGEGLFTFSDRYSIFDWGGMPDHIDYKGESIALLGAYFFEKLDDLGFYKSLPGPYGKWTSKKSLTIKKSIKSNESPAFKSYRSQV